MTEPAAKPLVSVERQYETDVTTGTTQVRMFVKMYFEARDSGLLADIGDRRWRTLCCLATYMDENGLCYPSQARIARDLGVHRQRVNERIRELLQYRFNERPVIRLEKRRVRTAAGERWASNVYQILPIAGLGMFDDRKPVSGNPDTGHRPVSGKPDTGNPDTNQNQVLNENTHRVPKGEGDDAHALVAHFHERLGRPQHRPTAKELRQAAELLSEHGPDASRFIVDFAVAFARRTGFKMRHFGAVLSYLDEALAEHQKRLRKAIREVHSRTAASEEALHQRYECWREAELTRLRGLMEPGTLLELERAALARLLGRTQGKRPPGFQTLLRIEVMRDIAVLHDVADFEKWRSSGSSAPKSNGDPAFRFAM